MSSLAAPLIAMVVVGGALAACLAPLLAPAREDDDEPRGEKLAEERDRLVAAIREADLDLAMGKITDADHAEIREGLDARALGVLADLDDATAGRERDGGPRGDA